MHHSMTRYGTAATDTAEYVRSMLGDRRDRIRHEGPELVWKQVADDLRADIRAGRLRRGARLPAVEEIASSYGVAAMTVRRAMMDLRRDGLVVVVVGRGTYIAE